MSERIIQFSWIEACLRYAGVFGSAEKVVYQEVFGVSEPSVSRHQVAFADCFEEQIGEAFVRDSNGRLISGRLELQMGFRLPCKPVFSKLPSLQTWLQQNLGPHQYVVQEVVRRDPDPWVMRSIIQSMRCQKPLHITYHSKSRDRDRVISPHALVRVVGRMHVRAFDHERNDFADFVLSRITRVQQGQFDKKYICCDRDDDWNSWVTLSVKPNCQKIQSMNLSALALDYGLDENGEKRMRVRKAIAPYLIDETVSGFDPMVEVVMSA